MEAIGLMDNSLVNLPEDPVRNLDFEAHGRKRVAEACVVTVAMSTGLSIKLGVAVVVVVVEV